MIYAFVLDLSSLFLSHIIQWQFIGPFIDLWLSVVVTLLRLGTGVWAARNIHLCNRPKKTMMLYEFESCPYCRSVRETLSVLGLDIIIYPCPKPERSSLSGKHRVVAFELCEKVQFPVLVDPNTIVNNKPIVLINSAVINEYLWNNYGHLAIKPLNYTISHWLDNAFPVYMSLPLYLRPLPRMGTAQIPSTSPHHVLDLYTYEGCPFSRVVRETLDCLEIKHHLRNCPKGYESNRREFYSAFSQLNDSKVSETSTQKFEPTNFRMLTKLRRFLNLIKVPVLVDRNSNLDCMSESDSIVRYLNLQYKIGESFFSWTRYMKDKAISSRLDEVLSINQSKRKLIDKEGRKSN